jgi:hypothetical protein
VTTINGRRRRAARRAARFGGARVSIPGVLETETKPIRNPVTGAEHRVQVVMPEGFEHHKAEIASASIASTGGIKFSVSEGHSSLAKVEQTPTGVAA